MPNSSPKYKPFPPRADDNPRELVYYFCALLFLLLISRNKANRKEEKMSLITPLRDDIQIQTRVDPSAETFSTLTRVSFPSRVL